VPVACFRLHIVTNNMVTLWQFGYDFMVLMSNQPNDTDPQDSSGEPDKAQIRRSQFQDLRHHPPHGLGKKGV
jgi:hypothetical protein